MPLLSEQGEEKEPSTTSCRLLPVKWNSSMSPIAAVTESGVKTKPLAPTCTVCVGDELDATVVAAAMEEVEVEPLPPYCARAGAARAERRRAEAVTFCIFADVFAWVLSKIFDVVCMLIGWVSEYGGDMSRFSRYLLPLYMRMGACKVSIHISASRDGIYN